MDIQDIAKDSLAVLEWYDENSNGPFVGSFVNIQNGKFSALRSDQVTDELKAYFANRDNSIFMIDVVKQDGQKSHLAVNIRYNSDDPGIKAKTLARFPGKAKIPVPSGPVKIENASQADQSQEKKPALQQPVGPETLTLEVFGQPIGGDTSGDWTISIELDQNNRPVEEALIKFRAGAQSFATSTDAQGCVEHQISVDDNVYGRVVYDSSLSLSGIPIAGPEKIKSVRRNYSGFAKFNNFLFLFWTLVLFVSLCTGVYSAYSTLTTPYSAKSAGSTNSTKAKTVAEKKSLESQNQQDQSVTTSSGWVSYTPFGSIAVWFVWLLVWIILIPLCFYDEIWEGVTRTYEKTHTTLEAWTHSRKPFHYSVKVTRNPDGVYTEPAYFKAGKAVNPPENHKSIKNKVKKMDLNQLLGSLKKYDLITDVAVMLFDRFVLGRFLGGK